MEMMLTGKTLRADKARRAGFVDRLVYPADAEATARELIARQPKQRRPGLLDRALSWAPIRPLVKQQLLAQVAANEVEHREFMIVVKYPKGKEFLLRTWLDKLVLIARSIGLEVGR